MHNQFKLKFHILPLISPRNSNLLPNRYQTITKTWTMHIYKTCHLVIYLSNKYNHFKKSHNTFQHFIRNASYIFLGSVYILPGNARLVSSSSSWRFLLDGKSYFLVLLLARWEADEVVKRNSLIILLVLVVVPESRVILFMTLVSTAPNEEHHLLWRLHTHHVTPSHSHLR